MQRFTLTDQHLTLLRAANVGWDGSEFGAPAIDSKRPYGNSDVYGTIGKLLGIVPAYNPKEDECEFTEKQLNHMRAIHKETQTALQVILATGAFVAGEYEADDYNRNWRLTNPREER
jgi:hypothetical protein